MMQARGDTEVLRIETEPACWRTFTGREGAPETLKPDLFAITASGEFEDLAFIEIDRGTESLAVLLQKCRVYQRYFNSGREQAESGLFPKVIWLIADQDRRERLRLVLEDDGALMPDLFQVCSPSKYLTEIRDAGGSGRSERQAER